MLATLLHRLWIGCCSVSMLLQTLLLLGKPPADHEALAGFVFGATVFAYQFFQTQFWHRVLAFAAGFGALVCLWWVPRFVAVQLMAPAVVWVLYYFAGEKSFRRIRFLKPASIAFVWAWVTVLLPLPWTEWMGAAMIFIGRALFILVLALAYDLSDLHLDRRHQLRTLVQEWGEAKTFRRMDIALAVAALVSIVNFLCKIYNSWAMMALIGSLVFTAVALRLINRRIKRNYWQKFWIDALMVIQFLIVLTGEFLKTGTLF